MTETVVTVQRRTITVIDGSPIRVILDTAGGAAAVAAHEAAADPHPQYAQGNLATVATTGQYSDLIGAPTALSAFSNDTNFITAGGAPVQSVAGKTGTVTLVQADITGLKSDSDVTHNSMTLSALTASALVATDSNKKLTSSVSGLSPTFTGLTLSGLTSGRVALVGTGGVLEDDAGLTYNKTTDVLTVAASGKFVTGDFQGGFDLGIAGVDRCLFLQGGSVPGLRLVRTGDITFTNSASDANATRDVGIARGGTANSLVFAGASTSAGAATSRTEINKPVSGFSNGVAKAALTVTVPNSQNQARIIFNPLAIMGLGGALNAVGEAVDGGTWEFVITRIAGQNTAIKAKAPSAANQAHITGGDDVTLTVAESAVSGASNATQTFTINATITRSAGSSDNHELLLGSTLWNYKSSGITFT